MDQEPRTAGPQVETPDAAAERTPEAIQADIERTREEVGDTVEALAAKTDVKGRAQARVEEIKQNVRAKRDGLGASAKQATPDGAQDGGRQAVDFVRANPAPFAIGSAVAFGFLLAKLIDRRSS